MKPALTREEWRGSVLCIHPDDDPKHRHQYAALALHNQPFGFTREDVKNLRFIYDMAYVPHSGVSDAELAALDSLIDRISALLPPED